MATGKLKIDIRRGQILSLLSRSEHVSVQELSQTLGATPTTIRTDLDTLAAEGRLLRVQGGAVAKKASGVPLTPMDHGACTEEKVRIARRALEYIHDGDSLFLNSGSTTLCVAQELAGRAKVNIVTNSLASAQVLASHPNIRVVLLGGEVNAEYGFTYGGDALQQLQRYQPDWAILSVDGVDGEQGITTYHAEEAMLNRMMVQNAHRTMITADHRKVGRAGFSRIVDLDSSFVVVTDDLCSPAALQSVSATGAQICVAESEGRG